MIRVSFRLWVAITRLYLSGCDILAESSAVRKRSGSDRWIARRAYNSS